MRLFVHWKNCNCLIDLYNRSWEQNRMRCIFLPSLHSLEKRSNTQLPKACHLCDFDLEKCISQLAWSDIYIHGNSIISTLARARLCVSLAIATLIWIMSHVTDIPKYAWFYLLGYTYHTSRNSASVHRMV